MQPCSTRTAQPDGPAPCPPQTTAQHTAHTSPASSLSTAHPLPAAAAADPADKHECPSTPCGNNDALTSLELSPESSQLCSESSQSVPLAPRHPLATPSALLFHREFFHPEDLDPSTPEAAACSGGVPQTNSWNPDLPPCMETQLSAAESSDTPCSAPQPRQSIPRPQPRTALSPGRHRSAPSSPVHGAIAGPPWPSRPCRSSATAPLIDTCVDSTIDLLGTLSSSRLSLDDSAWSGVAAEDTLGSIDGQDSICPVDTAVVTRSHRGETQAAARQFAASLDAGPRSGASATSSRASQGSCGDAQRGPRRRHIFSQHDSLELSAKAHTQPIPSRARAVAADELPSPVPAEVRLMRDSPVEGVLGGPLEVPEGLFGSAVSDNTLATGSYSSSLAPEGSVALEASGMVVSAVLMLPPRALDGGRIRPRQHASQSPSRNPPRRSASVGPPDFLLPVGGGAGRGRGGAEREARGGRARMAEVVETSPMHQLTPMLHSRPVLVILPDDTLALGYKERTSKRSSRGTGSAVRRAAADGRQTLPRRAAAAAVARAAVEVARRDSRHSSAPSAAEVLQPRASGGSSRATFAAGGTAPPPSASSLRGRPMSATATRRRSRSLSSPRVGTAAAARPRVRVLSAYCSAIPPPQSEGHQRYPRLAQRGGSMLPQGEPHPRLHAASTDSDSSPVSAPNLGSASGSARPQFLHPPQPQSTAARRAALLSMHARAAARSASEHPPIRPGSRAAWPGDRR